MDYQKQRDEVFRYLIPCAAKFIDEYFESPLRISFLLPDTLKDIAVVIESLTKELCIPNVIYTLNVSLTSTTETSDALTNVVILSESGIILEASNSSFVSNCEYDCHFIIVLTNPFTDKESFLMEAGLLVQQMSLESIFKLEILASVGDSVLLASSLPVRINGSYALAEPAFSGKCERQAAAADVQWQRFTNKTNSSYDVNTINAGMFDNFPFSCFVNDTGDVIYFGGVEGSMIEEIARRMEIPLKREMIEWTQGLTLKTEMYLRFYNASDDLVFGGILWDYSRKVTYTTCYGMVHISWMIPIEINVSLRGLIAPFDPDVWYTIICVLIAGGLVKLFIIRDITFLDIVGLVIGVPTFRQPTRHSSRIKFISWALFGFFLTQFYLGMLADYLIRISDLQMESIQELVESGLKMGGTQRFTDLIQVPDKLDDEEKIDRIIREKITVFEQQDYHNQYMDLIQGKNTSVALLVMLNLTSNPDDIGHAHIIEETMGSYPLALVVRRDFPYLKEFNYQIQVCVQAGLVNYWSNMAALNGKSYTTESDDDDSRIEIDDLAPAFFLLIIGYFSGYCLLLIEVIFYPSKLLS
ncbi:uncharacterized protein [Cardiocondyla obscurior]